MVLPFILAGAAALAPTAMAIGSKVGKYYGKTGSFGKASTFGLGYGASTAVGYNLIPQWNRKSYSYNRNPFKLIIGQKMPYPRYPRRSRQ